MKILGTVELTARDGEKFLIDEEDLDIVGSYTWRVFKGYVVRSGWRKEGTHNKNGAIGLKGKGRVFKLHRLIGEKHKIVLPGEFLDHINRLSLDNRKINLRKVTPKQNAMNKTTSGRNTSGVVGVCFVSSPGRQQRWLARTGDRRKRFYTKEEATAWRLSQHAEVLAECGL